MKFRYLLLFAISACYCLFATTAKAQSTDTYLYIVHGAPGRSISSSTNPALPVDVMVNGSVCLVQGMAFGDVKGPFEAAGGSYTFKVSTANSASPCSNPSIYEVTTNLQANETNFAVIGVTPQQAVTGYLFAANLNSIPVGQSQASVINVSDATLNASLTNTSNSSTRSLSNIGVDTEQVAFPPSGMYTGSVYLSSNQQQVFGPISVDLQPRNLYAFFLVGSTANGTLQIIQKTIKDVF